MGKEKFNAYTWLNNNSGQTLQRKSLEDIPPQVPLKNKSVNTLLSNFCVSGWRGEDLISKTALNIKKIIYELAPDAETIFRPNNDLNRSLKILIFNEYIAFSKIHTMPPGAPNNFKEFWINIVKPKSPYGEYLERFKKIYSFRVVVCYLFKIRFITKLCDSLSIEVQDTTLINPNSAIRKFFKKGSSNEVECESLQTNQYSWYHPSIEYKNKIKKLSTHFHLIGIAEIMKICTYDDSFAPQEHLTSPTLSNKNFGLFLNTLLVFFPYWINGQVYPRQHNISDLPKIKNCKYSGDQLTSLTLSHWLAQEENMKKKWDLWTDLICPNFHGANFIDGDFIKICHELQFLVFLIELATKKNHHPQKFISHIMKAKYHSNQIIEESGSQFNMFSQLKVPEESEYDRIILNLTNLPKTNTHHSLLNSIQNNFNHLTDNGYLFVFTNQKLFVPSQSSKIKQFLEKYKVDANFNFEQLKGKGEITNHLYILSKRPAEVTNTNKLSNVSEYMPKVSKYPCMTFRLRGELDSFQQFDKIVIELENVLLSNNSSKHPIYHKELSENILFEYFQDAIIDGKLIHSASQNPDNITHPSFFKNLTTHCSPFKNFFKIDNIYPNDKSSEYEAPFANKLLGINDRIEDKYPLILIANLTNPNSIKLEIVSSQSYMAKVEEYGHALFKYFGLTPKTMDLNIDLFRAFFNSPIGNQLIQLSLNSNTKVKSKLELLLIPKFFSSTSLMNEKELSTFDLLNQDENTIKGHHPNDLTNYFKTLTDNIGTYKNQHPYHLTGLLIKFRQKLYDILKDFDHNQNDGKKDYINYHNPLIINDIITLETFNVYPENSEVYIDFISQTSTLLNAKMTRAVIIYDSNSPCIELFSDDKCILKIYSDLDGLHFIKFIIDSSINMPILSILHNLHIPRVAEIKKVINNFQEMKTSLNLIYTRTDSLINKILTEQIAHFNQYE